MPPVSEVRTTFTIDLVPFAAGLKTMLEMTQAAGKQITPLLNMQVKAPNFAAIDAPLKQLTKTTDDYIAAQVASVKEATMMPPAMNQVGGSVQDLENKTKSVTVAHTGHETSLRGVRREATHSLTAILFLSGSLMQLTGFANQAEGSQKNLAKSMTQGLGAGLGFAGMLSMIPGVGIPVALAIGVIVTMGVGLLDFFDKSAQKAERAALALKLFTGSLSGASVAQLNEQRTAILDNLAKIDKGVADAKAKIDAAKASLASLPAEPHMEAKTGDMIGGGTFEQESQRPLLKKQMVDAKEASDYFVAIKVDQVANLHALDDKATAQMLTTADAQKAVRTLELKTIDDSHKQRVAQANADLKQQLEENQKITAGTKERIDADNAAQKIHTDAIGKIRIDELKALQDHQTKIAGIDKETALIVVDMNEKTELATAKTELDKIAITEKYALKRLAIETEFTKQGLLLEKQLQEATGGPDAVKRIKELDDELAAIQRKQEAAANKIRSDSSAAIMAIPGMPSVGSIALQLETIKNLEDRFNKETNAKRRAAIKQLLDLEQQKLSTMQGSEEKYAEKQRRLQEEERRNWAQTHQFGMSLISGFTNGVRSMFDQLLTVHRQAANRWDAVWISMENTVISALADMAAKALENLIVDKLITSTATATTSAAMQTIAASAATAATLVSIATFGAAAAAGTAAVLAGLAATNAASHIPGFEKGGKTKTGEAGFIEGFKPEIIAPEKDFYDVARTEIIPRMLIEQDRQLNAKLAQRMSEKVQAAGGSSNSDMLARFDRLEAAIKGLRVENEFDGRHLKSVLKYQDIGDKRTGLKK